jgi:hypothetical protein
LGNDQEKVVYFIVEILRPKLAAEIEADTLRKHPVELFQTGGFSPAHSFHEFDPGGIPLVDSDFNIVLDFRIH